MISFIKGEVLFTDADSICIFANGIGWNVNVPDSSIYFPGSTYSIYCYTHFTQDQTTLWGLSSVEELKFFKKLVSVSGVGPRTASTLINSKGLDAISTAIEAGDVASLKVKGLGEKTLQKIIIELKGNLDLTGPSKVTLSGKMKDILEGLVHLGYPKTDVIDFLSTKNPQSLEVMDEKDIIKEFLRHT